MTRLARIIVGLGATALWAYSLDLPVFTEHNGAVTMGMVVLRTGYLGLLQLQPAWLANFVFPVCVISLFVAKKRWSIPAFMLLGLSASSFLFTSILGDDGWKALQWNAGFFVWNAANFLAGGFILLDAYRRRHLVA